MIFVLVMLLNLSAMSVFAADQTQKQTQNQLQTQDQLRDPEQDRLEVRNRLKITESALTQQQTRLQTMDQTRNKFPDCENHWAQNQVNSGWAFGLIQGYTDGSFGPEKNVSGIEGLIFTTRLMNGLTGIDTGNVNPEAIDWTGVPDWAKTQLQEQNALRLMEQTNYYMDANMNRLHVALMLAKAIGLEPIEVSTQTQLYFNDQNQFSNEDLGYVLALKNLGVVDGYPDGTFQPNGSVTRAEICTMMTRILDLLK